MTALIAAVVLLVSAFAIDLGVQRVARADMQALADVVALDLARELDGQTRAALATQMNQARDKSVARNASTVGATPDVRWQLGTLDGSGDFHESAGGDVPTAVKTIANTSVKYSFVSGDGDASRSAVASSSSAACFSVGSYGARLKTDRSAVLGLLGPLLGLDLTVLSADGIASLDSAQVPLVDLATELGVGTADELIGLSNLSLADFMLATANVIDDGSNTAAVTALEALAVQVGDIPLSVGDVLDLGQGNDSALDLDVNALDLISTTLFLASDGNAVQIPDLGIDLGVLNLDIAATVVEPPTIACGPIGETTARSAQVDLTLSGKTSLSIVLASVNLDLDIDLQVAAAEGTLRNVQCSSGDEESASVTVNVSSQATDIIPSIHLATKLLGIGLVGADVALGNQGVSLPMTPVTLTFPDETHKSLEGANSLGVPQLEKADLTLLGFNIPGLGTLLSGTLNPLIEAINVDLLGLLNPILRLLGVSVGGADVAALGRPLCNSPKLRG